MYEHRDALFFFVAMCLFMVGALSMAGVVLEYFEVGEWHQNFAVLYPAAVAIYCLCTMAPALFALQSFALQFNDLVDNRDRRAAADIEVFVFCLPILMTVLFGFYRSMSFTAIFLYKHFAAGVAALIAEYRLRVPLFVLIVIAAVACSYAAYAMRTFKRIHYGLTELLFGLSSIIFSVYSVIVTPFTGSASALTDNDISQAAFGFFAGVYIIVRGLVNIEDGLKEGMLTPRTLYVALATRFRAKVRRKHGVYIEITDERGEE